MTGFEDAQGKLYILEVKGKTTRREPFGRKRYFLVCEGVAADDRVLQEDDIEVTPENYATIPIGSRFVMKDFTEGFSSLGLEHSDLHFSKVSGGSERSLLGN